MFVMNFQIKEKIKVYTIFTLKLIKKIVINANKITYTLFHFFIFNFQKNIYN